MSLRGAQRRGKLFAARFAFTYWRYITTRLLLRFQRLAMTKYKNHVIARSAATKQTLRCQVCVHALALYMAMSLLHRFQRLAMTKYKKPCHCEERSDEANSSLPDLRSCIGAIYGDEVASPLSAARNDKVQKSCH